MRKGVKQKCKHAKIMDADYNIMDNGKQVNIKQDLHLLTFQTPS